MGHHRERRAEPPIRGLRRTRGFSIVELVITLVVLSILAAFAIPQITAVINASRVTSEANDLLVGMQLARMEAIRGNVRTTFCASNDGATCANAAPWQGWVVFADRDFDGANDPGELVRAGNIEAPITVRASTNLTNNQIVFRADGLAYRGNALLAGNLRVCMPRNNPPQNARDISIAVGGRIAVRPAANVGVGCPAPGN